MEGGQQPLLAAADEGSGSSREEEASALEGGPSCQPEAAVLDLASPRALALEAHRLLSLSWPVIAEELLRARRRRTAPAPQASSAPPCSGPSWSRCSSACRCCCSTGGRVRSCTGWARRSRWPWPRGATSCWPAPSSSCTQSSCVCIATSLRKVRERSPFSQHAASPPGEIWPPQRAPVLPAQALSWRSWPRALSFLQPPGPSTGC